ncbi:hypothetical protein J6590_048220 [Homalodisca vitripennis]|nr:hypothetical protein J6590_048220 [Homalodisca vitripennis]
MLCERIRRMQRLVRCSHNLACRVPHTTGLRTDNQLASGLLHVMQTHLSNERRSITESLINTGHHTCDVIPDRMAKEKERIELHKDNLVCCTDGSQMEGKSGYGVHNSSPRTALMGLKPGRSFHSFPD